MSAADYEGLLPPLSRPEAVSRLQGAARRRLARRARRRRVLAAVRLQAAARRALWWREAAGGGYGLWRSPSEDGWEAARLDVELESPAASPTPLFPWHEAAAGTWFAPVAPRTPTPMSH